MSARQTVSTNVKPGTRRGDERGSHRAENTVSGSRRHRSRGRRRRPGRPRSRSIPGAPGAAVPDLRARRRHRYRVARALGLTDALHTASLQRPARDAFPRRPRRLPDPRRRDRLPRALRRDLRASGRAEQRDRATRARRGRPVPPHGRRTCHRRRPGRRRNRAVPDGLRAEVGREARCRCLPDTRRRLPPTRGRARGNGPRGRRRQHGLSDRQGALRGAESRALGRLPSEALAPARARARSLLVADQGGHPEQVGRVARWAASSALATR